jgi:hypothetical protein
MSMNLDEIQSWVKDLIAAHPLLAPHSSVILLDDGTYPKTPDREKLLKDKGFAIVVWEPDSEGLDDLSQRGMATHSIYVPVVIEANVTKNNGTGGTGIKPLRAVQYVLAACSGKRPSVQQSNQALVPMDPPFKNFGHVNGNSTIVVNLELQTTIIPV